MKRRLSSTGDWGVWFMLTATENEQSLCAVLRTLTSEDGTAKSLKNG
jgi:hypothetical protein